MINKFFFFLMSLLTFSEVEAQLSKDEIQMIQSTWGVEKRDIVTNYMGLTDTEAKSFWPIYDQFQDELRLLGSDRIKIITDYVNNVSTLTDDTADDIALNILKNNTSTDKLQKKYYKKMKKAIGPIRALSYMQLEYYLQTMMRAKIQNSIPFIGELDKKAK